MFHPHTKRLIVFIAGIAFLAYAFATDERTTRTSTDEEGPDPDENDDDQASRTANVVDRASEAGGFGTLMLAVKQAGLTQRLEGDGPFTIFAPTDQAFGALGEKLDELLANTDRLRHTVERHIVPGRLTSSDLSEGATLSTLGNTVITVATAGGIKVNGCVVVEPDLTASNGVIHGIDAVLPEQAEEV